VKLGRTDLAPGGSDLIQRGEGLNNADTIEGAREIVRGQATGRYYVDEIQAVPFPSGHTSRQWGRMIRHPDGRVEDEPHPWSRKLVFLGHFTGNPR
jgi:hypothetical protein